MGGVCQGENSWEEILPASFTQDMRKGGPMRPALMLRERLYA